MTNQTHRVCELIKRFNNNEKVCIDSLQLDLIWEGKSVRSIRRDLEFVKIIFPGTFKLLGGEKGCYKALTKQVFDNFLDEKKISLMVQVFSIAQYSNMFENLDIDSTDKTLIEDEIKKLKNVYEFKTKPFESKPIDYEITKKLENAIKYKKEIIIKYQPNGEFLHITIKPYKIVFMSENFYLASEVEHQDYIFSLYRITKIHSIELTGRNFYHSSDIDDFIGFMQTPLAKYTPNFKEHLVEVKLEVDSKKSKYFKAKKHLASQIIEEEKENGNLILKFEITDELEIEDLIKSWIPYIKIISPLSLKKKVIQELTQYIQIAE